MSQMNTVAVLGAGITGITTAAKLMEQGFEVTVFDRQRYAAMETSFANGGQLSASNAEVWNTWATVLKGIKWMLQADAPLLVNPKPSWHKLSWMFEFMRHIPDYERNTIETARLAIAARQHLTALGEQWGVSFDHSECGIMHFYSNQKDYNHACEVTKLLKQGGLEREALSPSDIKRKEPKLQGNFVGGFWTPSDTTGDIHNFTFGLAEAIRNAGVTFCMDTELKNVAIEGAGVRLLDDKGNSSYFDAVVICAGVGSRDLAKKLGDRVNIYPVKGYSITVNLRDQLSQDSAPLVSLLDDETKIVTSRLGPTRFRIAGTAEFNGNNRDIRQDRIEPLVKWCNRHFPEVSTQSAVPWAGLRPMMPNMMPKVGRGTHPQVFYNTGHGHLGWTLSGATADMIAGVMAAARDDNPAFTQVSMS